MKTNSKISLLALALFFIACPKANATGQTSTQTVSKYEWVQSIHTALGVPEDADTTDDYIIVRKQYVLSYNKNRNLCNWVSWELNASWFGDTPRYNGNFITDTSLPDSFYRVKHSDYTNSGYDRGHMVMSEERTASEEDNKSTFILSNVIPQRPNLNRKVWLSFESFCNDLCLRQKKELFIVAGAVFHSDSTISNGVAVPDSCWKIVIVLDAVQRLKDVTANTTVYAVMMPNADNISGDWTVFQQSIRQIETSTGYDFLSFVDRDIQDILEIKTTTDVVSQPDSNSSRFFYDFDNQLCLVLGKPESSVCVFNTLNQLVLSSFPGRINVSILPTGCYFLVVDGKLLSKFIKI